MKRFDNSLAVFDLARLFGTIAIAVFYFCDAVSAFAQPPDSQPTWIFPAPQYSINGNPTQLITRVDRDREPAVGWRVRYKISNSDFARFLPSNAETAVVEIGQDGTARLEIAQVPSKADVQGTVMVGIEVIQPTQFDQPVPEPPVAKGTTSITWSAAELQLKITGPELALPDQDLLYTATLFNDGKTKAENVILSIVLPKEILVQATSVGTTEQTDGVLLWKIGPLVPKHAFDVSIHLISPKEMDLAVRFDATGNPNLRQQKAVHTLVKRPQLSDAIPSRTLLEPASEDYKNDPLFLEIQRLLLKGDVSPTNRNDVVHGVDANNASGSQPSRLDLGTPPARINTDIDSISDAHWHAAESILAAARFLEKDVADCNSRNDINGVSKNLRVIKTLRTQAIELLHGK